MTKINEESQNLTNFSYTRTKKKKHCTYSKNVTVKGRVVAIISQTRF